MKGILFLALLLGVSSCQSVSKYIAGVYDWEPLSRHPQWSNSAQALFMKSARGIPRIIDVHMHALCEQHEGCYLNPKAGSALLYPVTYVRSSVIRAALGISHIERADEESQVRLIGVIGKFPEIPYIGGVFAFAKTYDERGQLDLGHTSIATPNSFVLELQTKHLEHVFAVGSVHPYDPEAIKTISDLAKKGIRAIKWLPNSQFIDARDSRSYQALKAMAEHKIVLITHVGDEHAVSIGGVDNALGNPMFFEEALRTIPGLRIVFAHVGSEGSSAVANDNVENFKLVVALLKKYPNQAYADISALSCVAKRVKYLKELLKLPELNRQLLYGTDYPLVAVQPLFNPAIRELEKQGLLGPRPESKKVVETILEIHRHNPLAAAFVAMRTVEWQGAKFPEDIFFKNVLHVFLPGELPAVLR